MTFLDCFAFDEPSIRKKRGPDQRVPVISLRIPRMCAFLRPESSNSPMGVTSRVLLSLFSQPPPG